MDSTSAFPLESGKVITDGAGPGHRSRIRLTMHSAAVTSTPAEAHCNRATERQSKMTRHWVKIGDDVVMISPTGIGM